MAYQQAANPENVTAEIPSRRRLVGYAALFALVAVAVIGAVGGINYFIDVNDVFQRGNRASDRVVRAYVEAARGAEIGVPFSEEDRPVKLLLGSTSTADCLMIGSSHVMMFRRDNNPILAADCKRMDNLALISASYEDLLTMLGVAAANPNTKHVFINIDAFTFQREMHKKWQKNAGAFLKARETFGLSPDVYAKIGAVPIDNFFSPLFSFRYFDNNLKGLKRLFKTGQKDFDLKPLTEADLQTTTVLRPDGSMGLPAEFKPTPDDAEIGAGAARIKEPFIDPAVSQEMMQALIGLSGMGKKVTVVMTPLHPKVWECGAPLVCECLREVEPAIRRLAAAARADVMGSFDPKAFGLSRSDFTDDQHLRSGSVHKVGVATAAAAP
ncbi:hypothetical protein [Dongia sp. agr-C8]